MEPEKTAGAGSDIETRDKTAILNHLQQAFDSILAELSGVYQELVPGSDETTAQFIHRVGAITVRVRLILDELNELRSSIAHAKRETT